MKKIIILCMIFLILIFTTKLSANSALRYWNGVDTSGVAVLNDAPISVLKEELHFYLTDEPNHYDSNDNYNSHVSAKYTFHNDSNGSLDATFGFPYETSFNYETNDNIASYTVKVNDSIVPKKIRYSYNPNYQDFNIKDDIVKLCDEKIKSKKLDEAKKVYKVTLSESTSQAFYYTYSLDNNYIIFADYHSFYNNGNSISLGFWSNYYDDITLYFYGEYDSEIINHIKFYDNFSNNRKENKNATIKIKEVIELDFDEFIYNCYQEDSGISSIDYYNAFISKIDANDYYRFTGIDKSELLSWVEYSIHFEANETLTNEVSVPVYPSINGYYEPYLYEYKYLLSPASLFSSFKDLNIYIHTDYYIYESNIDFTKNDDGVLYAHLDSLPDLELSFSYCESENPTRRSFGVGCNNILRLIISILLFFLFVILSIPIVMNIFSLVLFFKTKDYNPNGRKALRFVLLEGLISCFVSVIPLIYLFFSNYASIYSYLPFIVLVLAGIPLAFKENKKYFSLWIPKLIVSIVFTFIISLLVIDFITINGTTGDCAPLAIILTLYGFIEVALNFISFLTLRNKIKNDYEECLIKEEENNYGQNVF